jgi:hypothetical protein
MRKRGEVLRAELVILRGEDVSCVVPALPSGPPSWRSGL